MCRLACHADAQLNNLCFLKLSLFPEGTRFTSDKHAASMKIAAEKGLPLLKHHLLPRTKGFTASIPHLRGKFDAIYDVVMAVEKLVQKILTE